MTFRVREFLLLGFLLAAMPPNGTAQNTAPAPESGASQSANIPYFTLRDGMDSVLILNNLTPHPIVTNVTIFNMHGDARPLDALTLPARGITQIDLPQALSRDRERFDSGNVEISYTGLMMQVTAQVSISSADKRIDIESREADMMDFASTKLAGIISTPGAGDKGYLAITDASPQPLSVHLRVGDHARDVRLSPRETHLVDLNGEFDRRDESAQLVRLSYEGLPGDIITTGFVLNPKTGYSSAFMMTDPSVAGSNVLAGVHFWAGAPPNDAGFPRGTDFHSPLLLANVSDVPVNAQVFINYTQSADSSAAGDRPRATAHQGASSQTPEPQHAEVGNLTIPPGGVQSFDLAEAAAKLDLNDPMDANGFEVSYDGAPGSLIAHPTVRMQAATIRLKCRSETRQVRTSRPAVAIRGRSKTARIQRCT